MASGARGGGADHLLGLLPALRKLGVQCCAAVGTDGPLSDRLRTLGFPVQHVSLMDSRVDPRNIWRLRTVKRASDADVVHYHGTRAAFFGGLTGNGIPSVYTAHGLAYRQEISPMMRSLLLGAERFATLRAHEVISVSCRDLKDLQQRGFVAMDRGVHIPNCVDTERFRPGSKLETRQHLRLPKDAFLVGTVSRLVPQKSVHDLIAATRQCEDVVLCIVGDGPLRLDLEKQATDLRDRVLFLGARDDVPRVLAALDVFALGSRWEGEPIALLEALSVGLPCVATNTEGAREILTENIGLLVPSGDPSAMAAAWKVLHADPERRERMGLAARDAMLPRKYESAARRLLEVYRDLLGS